MPSSAKVFLLLCAGAAFGVVPAAAQERCQGTFCDWYYGGSAPAPAQPAATAQQAGAPAGATPLMAPTGTGFFRKMFSSDSSQQPEQAASGSTVPSRIHIEGGGLAAMARGEKVDRCSGTLCDLYYGSSVAEPDQGTTAAASTEAVVAAAPAPDAMDEGERHRIRVRQAELAEAAKPRCNTTPGDPWKCYR